MSTLPIYGCSPVVFLEDYAVGYMQITNRLFTLPTLGTKVITSLLIAHANS